MNRYAILVSFIFIALPSMLSATTIIAVSTGSWVEGSTWSCGCQPTSSDNVMIPEGITVFATRPIVLTPGPVIAITIAGNLELMNGSIMVDSTDIISVLPGGKISAAGVGGAIYSGITPLFVESHSVVNGPATITTGVLPLALMFFKGQVSNHVVFLEWASLGEINFDSYSILRSGDSVNFELIATIKGAQYSLQRRNYSFIDNHPLPVVSYYLLKALDKDGNSANLNVVRIDQSTSKSGSASEETGSDN